MKGHNSIAFSITSDYDSIREKEVFADLLKVLMAFAYKLIGDSSMRLSKNKADLAYDLSMEAIKKHLENPNKFDANRNPDLVNYLKFHLLRRIISNHKQLKGQQNELLYNKEDTNGIAVKTAFYKEIDVHDSIDLKNCIKLIQEELSSDHQLKTLFDLRYIKEYSRAEVIEELKLTQGEYNNIIRRLDTIRKRTIKLQ